jgi:FdhD protein
MERHPINPEAGLAVITSRCSFEMVQAATFRIPVLVAISAPTTTVLPTSEQTGTTLVALARPDGITVYAHRGRIREC